MLVFGPVGFVYAQVIISEVMYDLSEGSDAGREWIEIQNTGSAPLDLSTWKLHEAEINHGLTVFQGDVQISPDAFAIISDTPAKFLIDHPGFTGTIFDSSFSLSNTGETLILKKQNDDKTFSDIDIFSYVSDQGGNGTGQTLQKVFGSWVSGDPTPGAQNVSNSIPTQTNSENNSPTNETSEQVQSSTTPPVSGGSSGSVEQTIFPDAGSDKTVIAGAATVFSGVALGIKKEPLQNAKFFWNFGDGTIAEGQKITHAYSQTGQYLVFLEVSSADRSNVDRAVVTVIDAPLSISSFVPGSEGYIEIQNSANVELDISNWHISDGLVMFKIPQNTFILAKKPIRFSNNVTRLSQGKDIKVLYPSGAPARMQNVAAALPVTVSKPVTPSVATQLPVSPSSVSVKALSEEKRVTQTAAVRDALPESKNTASSNMLWFGALGTLVVFAIGSVLFIRMRSRLVPQPQEAEERSGFEIIEDEE